MQMLLVESRLLEQHKVEKPEEREAAGQSSGERQHGALGLAWFG